MRRMMPMVSRGLILVLACAGIAFAQADPEWTTSP